MRISQTSPTARRPPQRSLFFRRPSRVAVALLPFFLSFFPLAGCDLTERPDAEDDRLRAAVAMQARDIGDARMYFERYLRKNPTAPDRWEVWQQLLNISLNLGQDRPTARDYFEIMLVEFAGDARKRRSLQIRLADLCNIMRDHSRAVALWEALAADQDTPAPERARVYRELSHAYLRRLEFSMATDVLSLCLKQNIPPTDKADCLADLAEAQMFTDEPAKAEASLRELLTIPELEEDRRVLAVFTLADVLDQQDRLDEARALFESIRDRYPNETVIGLRIANIKERQDAKKAPPMVVPAPRGRAR